MSISDYGELAILNAVGNNTSFVVAQCYAKLHVGDPGENGLLNPAVETLRVSVSFAAASAGAMASDAAVSWTNVAGTEDYTYLTLWDNLTAGNCLWILTVTANPVTAGDNFTINSGSLTLTLD